jgi:uncharacterized alpha-E superfamily protein
MTTMLSRVADNLYWMSRHIERAENTARIIDVYQNLILDLPLGIQPESQQARLLQSLEIEIPEDQTPDSFQGLLLELTFSESNPHSLVAGVAAARENARQVREQISSEMWQHLNRFYLDLKNGKKGKDYTVEPHDFYMAVKLDSHLFQGVTDATMHHDQGWHFIQIGRHVERVVNLISVLHVYMHRPSSEDAALPRAYYFEMLTLLKSVTAWEAYCKAYSPDLDATSILEYLLFNPHFPHSAHFCVLRILDSVNELARATILPDNSRLSRVVGRLQSNLSYDEVEEVFDVDFHTYLNNIRQQIHQIHDVLYSTFISYSIDNALK